ncbi:MAG: hypothetical protein KBD24_00390 [Candidatus Pacebacteria bacterium]|nr:hypothetical protein [Candidatus Paceibacterota bacterium]
MAIPTVTIELTQDTEVRTVLAYEEGVRAENVPMNTERVVRDYFKDIPVMARVAWCESRFVQVNPATGRVIRGIVNPNDVGVMQINETYHSSAARAMGFDLYTLKGNMAYARTLYEREGTQPWNASRACWQEVLALR